jgi:hypothetical protein
MTRAGLPQDTGYARTRWLAKAMAFATWRDHEMLNTFFASEPIARSAVPVPP